MNTTATAVNFPLPSSVTPSSPSVLLDIATILALYDETTAADAQATTEVTDAVKETITTKAKDLGWKSVVFTGNQVLLSSIELETAKATKVGKGNSATPSFDDIASYDKMDKFHGVN